MPLFLSGGALFSLAERHGGMEGLLADVSEGSAQGLASLCGALSELNASARGALRVLGRDAAPTLGARELEALLAPSDLPRAREALARAIALGFDRDADVGDDTIDLTLAELNAKKN